MKRPIVAITIIYILMIIIFVRAGDLFSRKEIGVKDNVPVNIAGVIDSEPSPNGNYQSFELKSKYIKEDKRWIKDNRRFSVLYFGNDIPDYGDYVEINGNILPDTGPSNPGGFDYNGYLKTRGICASIGVNPSRGGYLRVMAKDRGNPLISGSLRLKNRIMENFRKTIPEEYADLFGSIVFGMKASPIPDATKDMYKKAGVTHILVASGQQVSILIGISIFVLKAVSLPVWLICALSSLFMWSFTSMAGFGASILRASIMGQVLAAGMLFEREGDFYTSFSLSALVLLLMNPYNLFDIGFQLSYLATWSLVYAAPAFQNFTSRFLPKILSCSVSIAVAPVLVTTPVSLYNFSQLTPVAFLSNIFVVPMAEILTVLGFTSAIMGLVCLPVSAAINGFCCLLLMLLNTAIGFFSSLPYAYTFVQRPQFIFMLLYFAALIYAVEKIKDGSIGTVFRVKNIITISSLLVFFIFLPQFVFAQKQFSMTAIDVGQGDSILLEMPGGQKVLIDGGGKEQPFDSPSTRYASTSSAQAARSGFAQGKGPDAYEEDKTGSNIVVPFLHSKGINELDMVILSHPHDDHCGGLVSVLQKMKVDSVLDSGQSADTYNYRMFLSLIKQNHIKYDLGRAGQILNFGDVKGYVVWPMDPLLEGTSSDPNNNSIVIRFVYGRTSFLLPGDLGPEGESALLAQNWNLSSDVLKIGHHGSSTSSSPEFLDAVSPRYAVMSVGANNRYHLPSEKTLQRFEERGIPIYRTDMNGAVMVSSDGNNIDVHTAK